MQKNAIIESYSKDMMVIINSFDECKKSKNRVVKRMSLLSDALSLNSKIMSYVLNTTCDASDFDELTETLDYFEKISETINFHIERITKDMFIEDGSRSIQCMRDIISDEIKSLAEGNTFVKKKFSDRIKKCDRSHPPRMKE